MGRHDRAQPDGRARPAGHPGVGLRPARLDGARPAAAVLGRRGAARADQPARPRRGVARAARGRPAAADHGRDDARGRRDLGRAGDRDRDRRRVPARGVRGRARPAAAADAPRRRLAAAASAARRLRGGRRRRARVPVRAARRGQAHRARAGAARRALRRARADAGARHLGADLARLPRPCPQHPRLVRLRPRLGRGDPRPLGRPRRRRPDDVGRVGGAAAAGRSRGGWP